MLPAGVSMRFSEVFRIDRSPEDDWFDPHLTIDTALFIDPVLMFVSGDHWTEAHDELIQHFIQCYRLIAKSAGGVTSNSAAAARTLLTFPEPSEFCLGYTASGTAGAGSGAGFARQMADGIAVAIARGLDEPEHIEEVGILNNGVGADRISDAVSNVLKRRFIEYTREVAQRHGIELEEHEVPNATVVLTNARWMRGKFKLPTNPYTGRPVLLVPRKLLNDLPLLNAENWFYAPSNAELRNSLNIEIGQRVPKAEIVEIARQHPEAVREWARTQSSRADLAGYDYGDDPRGIVRWDGAPRQFAEQNPIVGFESPTTQAELIDLVDRVVQQFKHFIEEQRGWSLLWRSGTNDKPEEAVQLAFLGMAQPYLRLFGVELDREVELGRGKVDFKISSGSRHRLLIEVKKAHNGKFWNGLTAQLPSYLLSDDCACGWYVAVQYRDSSKGRMEQLPDAVDECAGRIGKDMRYIAIDARPKDSASKL